MKQSCVLKYQKLPIYEVKILFGHDMTFLKMLLKIMCNFVKKILQEICIMQVIKELVTMPKLIEFNSQQV
jgi:hypothetical protein